MFTGVGEKNDVILKERKEQRDINLNKPFHLKVVPATQNYQILV